MIVRWFLMVACLVVPTRLVNAEDEVGVRKAYEWIMAGGALTAAEVAKLETALEKEPDNLEYRTKLVAYYGRTRFTPSKVASYPKHVLEILRRHPASAIAGTPSTDLNPILNPKAYREAVEIWEGHLKKNPTDIGILSNAAAFFLISERDKAEDYLTKICRLDPENPEWYGRLGHLHALQSRTPNGVDPIVAKKSLAAYEAAMAKGKSDRRFPLWQEEAARAAVWAGELEKAETYATEVLSSSVEGPASWNYGNAVHHGNLVLGHVALQRGDAEAACKFLLRAGKTTGSPQLNSFGPNMSLALALFKKGERDVVIEYLKLCKKFWNRPKLADWIKDVENGVVPAFGGNLRY